MALIEYNTCNNSYNIGYDCVCRIWNPMNSCYDWSNQYYSVIVRVQKLFHKKIK